MISRTLDQQIGDLDALLKCVEEDWDTPTVIADKIWFAKLINKTIKLRDDLLNERRKLDVQSNS